MGAFTKAWVRKDTGWRLPALRNEIEGRSPRVFILLFNRKCGQKPCDKIFLKNRFIGINHMIKFTIFKLYN